MSSSGLPRWAPVTVMILLSVLVLLSHLDSVVVQQQLDQFGGPGMLQHPVTENTREVAAADTLDVTAHPVTAVVDGNMESVIFGSIITEATGTVNEAIGPYAIGNVSLEVQFGNTSTASNFENALNQSNEASSSSLANAKGVFGNVPVSDIVMGPVKFDKVVTCKKLLPTAIVVGIQKCGTTALGKFLDLHPQVKHAKGEVKYFSSHYSLGLDWYKNRLPCAMPGQIVTERSPGYFYRKETPRRINDLKEGIKLIIIVKDPIVRAQSNYAMGHGASASRFQETILKSNGEIDPQSHVIDFSLYSLYVKQWLDVFPLDRICFIDGHNLERNPEAEMKNVETFLNISSFYQRNKFVLNHQKGKPCFYKRGRKHCFSKNKGRKHPSVTPILQKKLEEFFHPLNEKFFSMINRRFEWGY